MDHLRQRTRRLPAQDGRILHVQAEHDRNVIERKNQNETLIDATTDQVLGRILLGQDGKWGDDVGHVKYDPELQRTFVTTDQLADPDSMAPNLLPPAGKSWLVEIDPDTQATTGRIALPDFCITPHGLAIDSISQIAFVTCVDSTPATLVRIDLQRMQVIQEKAPAVEANPDMLVIDAKLHILYVAAEAGISIFEEKAQSLRWLGNYTFGVSVHSLIVDEETHDLYLPLPRMGGRAVLRILHTSQTLI